MKKRRVWSQGDLVLIEGMIPEGSQEVIDHDGILLKGEATGHAHRVISGEARYFRNGKECYVFALTNLQIGHEDHFGFQRTIPAGISVRYGQEREANWLEEVTRNVAD